MCGFSGFTLPNSIKNNREVLYRMMSPIAHRGPDESSIHVDDKIALGHYRLSIIDIKGGKQPCIDQLSNNYNSAPWFTYDFRLTFVYVIH